MFYSLSSLYKYAIAICLATLVPAISLAQTPGKDGDAVISGTTIANEYAPLLSSASVGANSVRARSININLPNLETGDLIMIYQPQGASISGSESRDYGRVTRLNSAGRYEFHTVSAISGDTIFLENYGNICTGLLFSYSPGGNAQIVRVSQFRNLTINPGGRLVARPWDGQTGGVVAVSVAQNFTNNGVVDVSGAGFRGGATDNLSQPSSQLITVFASADPADGGEKGESIAGFQGDYPRGRYGRGAPANGGGGGVSHNSGGGGGANGNNGNIWEGQGIPDTSVADWVTAWNLDPSLTPSTRNSGGGRGGYSLIFGTDPLVDAPGSVAANNRRREVGGLGGRPLNFDGTGRIFFGGGGGAGDGNNDVAGAGGNGGGLAFIIANNTSGSGTILANGNNGASTTPGHNDAPGGGGAGGTIIIQSQGNIPWQMQADGGDGGDQFITRTESEGPGGGGGGGVIATSGGTSVRFARGGANGETTSTAMTRFLPNGATRGADGQPNIAAPSEEDTPFCRAPPFEPLIVSKTSAAAATTGPERFALPGNDRIYTITVENPSVAIDDGSIIVTDILPDDIIIFTGDFGPAGSGPIEFVDGIGAAASALICCNASQITYSSSATGNDFSYTPNGDFDPAVRQVRIRPSGSMASGLSTVTRFTLRFRSQIR